MKKVNVGQWLAGMALILIVSVGVWALLPVLRNAKLITVKKETFETFRMLYFSFPVISAAIFSGWWWKTAISRGTLITENVVRSARIVKVISVVVYLIVAAGVVFLSTSKASQIGTLVVPAIITVVTHVAETFVVCTLMFTDY